jgi:hypothetical protein
MPTKKAARQQPPGLKMRFRPVGFDSERMGSSHSSDDESRTESSSDQEMPDAPIATLRKAESLSTSSENSEGEHLGSHAKTAEAIRPSKLGTKSKISPGESNKVAGRSMKRKHSGDENKKLKHSSSRSAIADNRKLKRLKSQVEDQKTTDSRSVSSKARSIASTMLFTVAQSSSPVPAPISRATKSNTIVDPRSASLTSFAPILPPISAEVPRPSQISLARPNLTESTSAFARTDSSLIDNQVQAMDRNPAADERRNDSKRLGRNGTSSTLKVKPKGVIQSSADVDVEMKRLTPIPLPPSSTHALSLNERVHSMKENDKKRKKRRRKEEIANGVSEKMEALQKISLPRPITPILPPKYAVKR